MENFGKYTGSQDAPQRSFQLKWHKFLIYFALWAGALINAGNAVMCINGTQYQEQSEQIYAMYSGLKTLDLAWGIVLLGICAYMIYVRFQLAGFRIGAPRKLSILYIMNLVCSLAYLLAFSAVTHLSLGAMASKIIPSIFSSILLLFLNQNYYSKRLELFVN